MKMHRSRLASQLASALICGVLKIPAEKKPNPVEKEPRGPNIQAKKELEQIPVGKKPNPVDLIFNPVDKKPSRHESGEPGVGIREIRGGESGKSGVRLNP